MKKKMFCFCTEKKVNIYIYVYFYIFVRVGSRVLKRKKYILAHEFKHSKKK